MDDYITKPVRQDVLLGALERNLALFGPDQ